VLNLGTSEPLSYFAWVKVVFATLESLAGNGNSFTAYCAGIALSALKPRRTGSCSERVRLRDTVA
jgi:hypothetical protein